MEFFLFLSSVVSLAAWFYLWRFRSDFWRADQRLKSTDIRALDHWPTVTAIIPARNEADVIAESLTSLLSQDYPVPLSIIVVDDQSEDGTAEAVRAVANDLKMTERVTIVPGKPLQAGWAGKMWAVHQGLEAAKTADHCEKYVFLTDADIKHAPNNIRQLVLKAERDQLARIIHRGIGFEHGRR